MNLKRAVLTALNKRISQTKSEAKKKKEKGKEKQALQ
jgi:hypothetical protein